MEGEGSAGEKPMINMVLLLGIIATGFFYAYIRQCHRYYKTKYKPSLYMGITCFLFALASVIAMLIGAANFVNNLPLVKFLGRCEVTSGALGFVFLNLFAVAVTGPDEKMRGVWISFALCLAEVFVIWTCDIFVEGNIGGIPMFTETSMYKAPYGLPIVETTLALMAAMAAYPTYLFFRGAKETKYRVIKTRSLLEGIGIMIAATGYAIEITGSIPYQYMPIAIPMIMAGSYMTFFAFTIPMNETMSEEMVRSFVEKVFIFHVAPTVQTKPHVFSRALGLDHQQMAGRNILLEFDPASNYEEAIRDFAAEALANAELTVIFTRMGSAVYSSLKEQKTVKFFCLTQQVSVPKEVSENEMLLPANDVSLMFDVFDKTLKVHPEGNINMVFDSLSDLVMSIGFEKTYRFMKYAIEMLEPSRTTVMFLLNQTAHDPKVTSSFRSLLSNQISFGKEGMQTVKWSKAEITQVKTKENIP